MNEQKIVVSFTPHGTAHGLHHDEFDLGFLGPKTLSRASSIEFDETSQTFYVLPSGKTTPLPYATGFVRYGDARKFEVAWLQTCELMQVCDPHSLAGTIVASGLQERYRNNEL
jgi:hypothetical protein